MECPGSVLDSESLTSGLREVIRNLFSIKLNFSIRNECIYFNDYIKCAQVFAVHILHILRCLKIVSYA
jgi:hypothetical protein